MGAARKEKPGKVVRVDPVTWKLIASSRGAKETVTAVIRRLMGLSPRKGDAPKKLYVLPSALSESIEEARGKAILEAVKKKGKPEKPIAVRVES